MARFERAGVPVAKVPSEIPGLLATALAKRRKKASLKVVMGGRGGGKKGSRAKDTGVKRTAPKLMKRATKLVARKSTVKKTASRKMARAKKRRPS
jgi:hypothetical protein